MPENVSGITSRVEQDSAIVLKEIVRELQETKWSTTRIGIIKDVRKGPDYDKTKERLFVIGINTAYVYMPESEAPEWIQNLSSAETLNKEIRFKPVAIMNDAVLVSSKAILNMYRNAMKEESSIRGKIVAVYDDRNDEQSYIAVFSHGDLLYMARNDFSVFGTPHELSKLIGQNVTALVTEIGSDGVIHISQAILQARARDSVIEELQNHPEGITAKIKKIHQWGAYLTYNGVPLILRNSDFSTDYSTVASCRNSGDMITVKLKSISETRRIFVEAVSKYTAPVSPLFEYQKNQIITGKVMSTPSFGVFVRAKPGIDILCEYPQFLREPVKGETVNVRITSIKKNQNDDGTVTKRLRGKINEIVLTDEEGNVTYIKPVYPPKSKELKTDPAAVMELIQSSYNDPQQESNHVS